MLIFVWLSGCGEPNALPRPCQECQAVPARPRFARLTHLQWENTVGDLLHLDGPTGLSDAFMGDLASEGFDNDAENLVVSPELWQDYQRAAEVLALGAVTDAERYAAIVPQDPRIGSGPPVTDVRFEAESSEVEATAGHPEPGGWNLSTNGHLQAHVSLPVDGSYTLEARLWSRQVGSERAVASLGADNVVVGRREVYANSLLSAEVLSVELDLTAGDHVVQIGFSNDYDLNASVSRDLHVDWFALRGAPTLGASTAGPAQRDAWIAAFGRRAHRRPLAPDEIAAYAALFEQGPALVGSGDDFADGVRLVIGAMLQSPHFLYRIEASDTPAPDGRIPLSAGELASRLSYALWNTMPDEALLAAVDDGSLLDPEVLEAEIDRMLDHPAARATLADLHGQLLELDSYDNVYKDPELFPEFTERTTGAMRAEALAFVDDVVFAEGGGVHALFTSPYTFVNAELAPIYGLPGPYGDELVRVDLDPSQRAGLLTLSGFLAMEADAYVSNPIRRGVFVNRAVWCVTLPAPPPVVPPLPPPDEARTTRERVDAHTGAGTCGEGCHSGIINPPGFALEAYDALGRYRTSEEGFPVDASGHYRLSEGELSWSDPIEFAAIVGDAIETHRCYSQHLLEYLHGRRAAAEDGPLLDALARRSREHDRPIRELVRDVLLSDSFRMRAP